MEVINAQPLLSLTVSPKANVLDGLTLYEPVDKVLLKKLINSDLLKTEFNNKLSTVFHTNEKIQLEKYLGKMKKGRIPITYKRSSNNPYGRSNPEKALGLYPIRREIRHTLAEHIFDDYDIKNAHPDILLQLCIADGIECEPLRAYVHDRQYFYDKVISAYNCSEDSAKKIFLAYVNGGGFTGWLNDLNKDPATAITVESCSPLGLGTDCDNKLIIMEIKELQDFKKMIKLSIHPAMVNCNKHLVKITKDVKKAQGIIQYNLAGTLCSFVLQEYEIRVIEQVYIYCLANGFIENGNCVICADGIMLEKRFYNENLLTSFNDIVKTTVGLDLTFTCKPMKQSYGLILDNHIIVSSINTMESDKKDTDTSNAVFKILAPEFEKTHAKIINKAVYIKELPDEIIIMSKDKLKTSYEHMECGKNKSGTPQSFIYKWTTCNNGIRNYEDMNIYPDASQCPDDCFNLWRPFAYELMDGPYEKNIIGRDSIYNHIRILCDHDEVVYNYILDWIAHMLLFPARKSIVPTFISKQGAGKGTLIHLLSRIIGNNRVFETANPSRDVWGDFNGIMATAFLVNLDELSKKETLHNEGKMKNLASEPTIAINNKGMNMFVIKSYHRFIITTNNEDPVKTSKDDRRNLIIRSSDEKMKDKQYFINLRKHIDDDDIIRTICEDLKTRNVSPELSENGIPQTSYQNELKEAARPPHELFLENLVSQYINQETLLITPADTFEAYKCFCITHGYLYDGMNSTKLGVRLNNLLPTKDRVDYIDSKKSGILKKVFKIQALKKLFDI
jgi:hypothetical protein